MDYVKFIGMVGQESAIKDPSPPIDVKFMPMDNDSASTISVEKQDKTSLAAQQPIYSDSKQYNDAPPQTVPPVKTRDVSQSHDESALYTIITKGKLFKNLIIPTQWDHAIYFTTFGEQIFVMYDGPYERMNYAHPGAVKRHGDASGKIVQLLVDNLDMPRDFQADIKRISALSEVFQHIWLIQRDNTVRMTPIVTLALFYLKTFTTDSFTGQLFDSGTANFLAQREVKLLHDSRIADTKMTDAQ